jgi:hypothetical protein
MNGYYDPPEPDPICWVCMGNVDHDRCICPECPTCGVHGDPSCYVGKDAGHWLVLSDAQKEQAAAIQAEWDESCRREAEWIEKAQESWKILENENN